MKTKPVFWIPTVNMAEGIPYTVVIVLSVILCKLKGMDNTDIALYTSWLYLPWLIKPLWSPVVEMFKTSKLWIVATQLIIGALLASLGLTIPLSGWFVYAMIALWLIAFMSATHDIAADGLYIEALSQKQQATWVGIRGTFYKCATLLCQGGLVVLAGYLEEQHGIDIAWITVFGILAIVMTLFGFYHIWALPKVDKPERNFNGHILKNFGTQIKAFFKKDGIGLAIAFLLLYRLGESQLSKMSAPFMLDSIEKGGLGLKTETLGYINGTFGMIAMTVGGILGGIVIARNGLRYWLLPMILALNIPDAFYAWMASSHIQNIPLIAAMVSVEQFGYGFGFAAYSVYMLNFSKGEYSTSHYAICTAFMAAGMMLPGMASGYIQEMLGYEKFFWWVLICCIPSIIIAIFAKKQKLTEIND